MLIVTETEKQLAKVREGKKLAALGRYREIVNAIAKRGHERPSGDEIEQLDVVCGVAGIEHGKIETHIRWKLDFNRVLKRLADAGAVDIAAMQADLHDAEKKHFTALIEFAISKIRAAAESKPVDVIHAIQQFVNQNRELLGVAQVDGSAPIVPEEAAHIEKSDALEKAEKLPSELRHRLYVLQCDTEAKTYLAEP